MTLIEHLKKSKIKTGPSQTWKSVRLIPLIAEEIHTDLHLAPEARHEDLTISHYDHRTDYMAYIPHGLVLQNTQVSKSTQLGSPKKKWDHFEWGYLERMTQKQKSGGVRFLPQHLAISSYLAHHFQAPEIYWRDFYNRPCLKKGLSLRQADVFPGEYLVGLEQALRLFEIHDNQVGMLLFLDDRLVSAVIYPHPQDYRRLHPLLLHDQYGQELWWASLNYRELPPFILPDPDSLKSLDELALCLKEKQAEIASFHESMKADIFQVPLTHKKRYQYKNYTLESFLGPMEFGQTGFAGEMIYSQNRVAYLHLFWLNQAQVKDAWYLQQLHAHEWDPYATAESMNIAFFTLVQQLEKTALKSIVQGKWFEQAQKAARDARRKG